MVKVRQNKCKNRNIVTKICIILSIIRIKIITEVESMYKVGIQHPSEPQTMTNKTKAQLITVM